MSRQPVVYTVKRWHVATVVMALVAVGVSLPVGVMAATGSVFNLRDYSNTAASGWSRISNNRLVTEQCDPATTGINATSCARVLAGKMSVGDGSGPLTVDGSVQQAPTTPYAQQLSGSSDGFYPSASVTVPAGKRWVIESVSIEVSVPSGQPVLGATLQVVTGGTLTYQHVPMVVQGTYSGNNYTYYSGAVPMRLYADASTSVTAEAFKGAGSGSGTISAEVSGYLV